jgi:hypothetical protein
MPTTTIAEPMTLFDVTFSRSRTMAAKVEKRGVVEDIGTARDSKVPMKL